MRRQLAHLVAMACLAASALAVPTASAAPQDCPLDKVCVWSEPNFQGTKTELDPPRLECMLVTFKSVSNNSRYGIYIFNEGKCDSQENSKIVVNGGSEPNFDGKAILKS